VELKQYPPLPKAFTAPVLTAMGLRAFAVLVDRYGIAQISRVIGPDEYVQAVQKIVDRAAKQ